nr:hypothetical protein [Tanacetum cinerariifolium]
PLPPVISPTAESSGYVAESDPEEDPEEYEEDETEDGPVGYSIDGGDDGDNDDIDSLGYDADNKDEDEEEYLALADSTTTSISLPPEAEVERLLAMLTPPPSPLSSLSPPSTRERLARCTTPVALPSPPLPPSLYPPPHVDRRDGIPESEQPPRKRLCLATLGSRYEAEMRHRGIREVGYGIRDTWIDPTEVVSEIASTTLEKRVDLLMGDRMTLQETVWTVEEEAYAARKAWAQLVGLNQTSHHELQTLREQTQQQLHETHSQMQQTEMAGLQETDRLRQSQIVETPWVIRDIRREMGDMHAELLALRGQPRRAGQPGGDIRVPNHQDAPRDTDITRQGQNPPPLNTNTPPHHMTPESVQAMIDQALLRNSTNGDGSQSSHKDNPRHVQTTRPYFYADFMKCHPDSP